MLPNESGFESHQLEAFLSFSIFSVTQNLCNFFSAGCLNLKPVNMDVEDKHTRACICHSIGLHSGLQTFNLFSGMRTRATGSRPRASHCFICLSSDPALTWLVQKSLVKGKVDLMMSLINGYYLMHS